MTSGYSGTPLPAKLGITAGSRVLVLGKPSDVHLGDPPASAVIHNRRGAAPYDVGIVFTATMRALALRFAPLVGVLNPAGALWVCWPKKSSDMTTDLSEGAVRAHGLDEGLVDVKIAAIDNTWSALKFVRRLADR